jgi:hypothetical protein
MVKKKKKKRSLVSLVGEGSEGLLKKRKTFGRLRKKSEKKN